MSVEARPFDRREFLKLAAAATAVGASGTSLAPNASAQERRRQDRGPPPAPPPNSLAPSIQFQAAPGGTGAYLEKIYGGSVREPDPAIEIEPWVGPVPTEDAEIAFLPVTRLAALIRAQHLSPVRLTKLYLERLKRLDEKLLFVVHFMEESALAEAQQAEQEIQAGNWRGPLHGIPWGAKDLFATKGVPTTWGAKPFEDRVIDEDAEVVVRLRNAGAILVAKLSLGTFAMGDRWFRGMTRNPWNPEQGSSGSSAGPASATAAGCVGFALGTETLGSIVSPSRRCGISALRPTFGRVSRHGAMALSWSMDKVGPMCRSIEDCALVFAAIHGADPKDPSTLTTPFRFDRSADLSEYRIGYTEGADEGFLDELRDLGAEPRLLGERPSSRGIGSVLGIESAAAFDDFLTDGLQEGMVNPRRAESFRRPREVSALEYLQANRRRLELMHRMQDFMADLDLYVSNSGDLSLTNLTGHPTAVLPYTFEEGRPRCIMLVGDLFADDKLLSVGTAYQYATDWHERRPELG